MTGTAYELKLLQAIQKETEYKCPICFKTIDLDDDSDDEFLFHKNELYHCDCIYDEIKKHGRRYIKEKLERDYFEWYFNCRLKCSSGDMGWDIELADYLLKETQNIIDFIDEDSIEYFLDWLEEENEETTQI